MKTISCIGLGDRGTEYLRFIKHFNSKKIKVTALCDIKKSALDEIAPIYKIPENMRFLSADEFFKNGALSDAVIISTQDKTHFDITKRAIEAGYKYILLEKPVSDKIEECIILRDMAKERGVTIVVCHVLRYSDYYRTIKDAIRSGAIGELISINHVENIGYFHFSHSYVRGSWRREELSSPSILAKCCHDLDLLGWFVDKKPVAVSSTGGLHYFKRENAPEGAAERCLAGCKAKENCVYDCEALYITDPIWRATFLRLKGRTITGVKGATKEQKYQALKEGPYGRCVYQSDNDVCDHQIVNILFEDGKTATLTMTAFSAQCHRESQIVGTKGEIIARKGKIYLKVFKQFKKNINKSLLRLPGHIEGDIRTVASFVRLVNGELKNMEDVTTIDATIQSHRLAHLAEISRKSGGELVKYEE